MDNDENTNQESEVNTENETDEAEDFIEEEANEQATSDADELKKKLAISDKKLVTALAQKNHYKNKVNSQEVSEKKEEISSKDLYALMNNKVPEEDVDDVIRAAKALDMSIPEALKSNVVKTILSDSKEKRTTADVANTDNTRMGPTQLTDETLLSNAVKGDIPDDDEGIAKLIEAKLNK